jgi:spermidine synthase
LKFITQADLRDLFNFPPDMSPVKVEVNRLNNQSLVRYFEEEWAHYVH